MVTRSASRSAWLIVGVAMALLLATGARAETVVATELTLMAAVERTQSLSLGFYNLSEGKFSLNSAGSAEVKGQLTVDVKVTDTVILDITKAWVKARLGDLRLTVGKTRLSWGEGYMFNAGDVIFNGKDADLSAEDLRDNNAWLMALYVPLGDFSFIEAVMLPPDLPIKEFVQYYQMLAIKQNGSVIALPDYPTLAGFDTSSGGGRVYTKLGEMKLEAGYLYDGTDGLHKPYFSLQGNLLADLHLSSSIAIPATNPWTADTPKSWQISAGMLYQVPISAGGEDTGSDQTPSSGSLDFRLEASIRPFGTWDAQNIPFIWNPLTGTSIASSYALSVFPQISWKSDTVFAYLRGVWSPVDMSAIVRLGLQWSPLQGFNILGGFSWQMGEPGDTYGFDRAQGWQFTIGTRFNF